MRRQRGWMRRFGEEEVEVLKEEGVGVGEALGPN